MNKQELITRIEKIEYEHLHYNSPESMLLEQKHKILDLVEQLDEPQKPVVPKFVAEWFEDNKDALDLAIFMETRELDVEEWPHKTDFENWLDVAENKPIETLIRMKDGYEVEKEQLYRVIMPNPQSKNGNVLVLRRTQQGTITVNKVKKITARLGEGMDLTEEEIKSVDERYWPFAVPVEEVGEG
ncbi:DUF1642 domain-containing protein [Enterococcus faecium]|uniref:DUF1642 domain-containing protein n=1 Tax=Enterococcus faecium TaxID=1352 RepID=UPI0018F69E7D|nr:DUF1642 domain-containing protein [Enterococcus faecium]MBJ7247168.1 DUF1642 domain-containing protein [Enterococcus faecium]